MGWGSGGRGLDYVCEVVCGASVCAPGRAVLVCGAGDVGVWGGVGGARPAVAPCSRSTLSGKDVLAGLRERASEPGRLFVTCRQLPAPASSSQPAPTHTPVSGAGCKGRSSRAPSPTTAQVCALNQQHAHAAPPARLPACCCCTPAAEPGLASLLPAGGPALSWLPTYAPPYAILQPAPPFPPRNPPADERPSVWFDAREVWEIRGADLTLSPVSQGQPPPMAGGCGQPPSKLLPAYPLPRCCPVPGLAARPSRRRNRACSAAPLPCAPCQGARSGLHAHICTAPRRRPSQVHKAAVGRVHEGRGIGLRFPRFLRIR